MAALADLTKQIQNIVGTTADGIIGPKTLTGICNKLGLEFLSNQKECIRNIQTKVGSTPDGIYGPNTANAILKAFGVSASDTTPLTSSDTYRVVPGDLVIIDIGHTNSSGASGNEIREHDVNVVIAAKLKKMLEDYGARATVMDFPDLDNGTELNKTVREANKIKGAKVLISLHSDWASSASAKGGHVCYRSDASKHWALKVTEYLQALLPGRADKIVYRPNLAVLKVSSCPAILVESGFVSNPHDAEIMKNHPELIAESYFKGLTK